MNVRQALSSEIVFMRIELDERSSIIHDILNYGRHSLKSELNDAHLPKFLEGPSRNLHKKHPSYVIDRSKGPFRSADKSWRETMVQVKIDE